MSVTNYTVFTCPESKARELLRVQGQQQEKKVVNDIVGSHLIVLNEL